MREAYDRRVSEERAAENAIAEARRAREREALEQREEREYQAAIRAGGDVAAGARWERRYSEVLRRTGHGLCQWQDEGPDGDYRPRMCLRRASDGDVYCAKHNRQLERETRRSRTR
jgi:hypothetical protein